MGNESCVPPVCVSLRFDEFPCFLKLFEMLDFPVEHVQYCLLGGVHVLDIVVILFFVVRYAVTNSLIEFVRTPGHALIVVESIEFPEKPRIFWKTYMLEAVPKYFQYL